MKVCFVNTAGPYGSTGNICCYLMASVVEDGDSLLVGQQKNLNKKIPGKYFGIFHGSASYKFHRIATFLDGSDGFRNSFGSKRIYREIKNFGPDLIHIHNLHGTFFNISFLSNYIAEFKVPVVYTLHDAWTITGRCAYFFSCEKWKVGCGKCPNKSFYPRSLIDRSEHFFKLKHSFIESISPCTVFVSPSDWLLGVFAESYPTANAVVIRNGIDRSVFRPTDVKDSEVFSFAEGRKIVGAAANAFNKTKGIDDLIYLSGKLDPSKYVVCALGAEKTHKISDNLLFIKKTNSKPKINVFYNTLDLFVSPSKQDNYPTTHLEALSAGTRVLTYKVGGADEMIVSNSCGASVPSGDIKSMVSKTIDLCDRPVSKKVVSQNCGVLDTSEMVDKYLNLYSSLLSKPKR